MMAWERTAKLWKWEFKISKIFKKIFNVIEKL